MWNKESWCVRMGSLKTSYNYLQNVMYEHNNKIYLVLDKRFKNHIRNCYGFLSRIFIELRTKEFF